MNRFSYIFLSFPLTFKECLFHALKQKKYNVVAALVFVMDRFTYWQGSSHTTLQLVDYLKANSPDTPIAPQLLIRKVRIMKNAGDLQGNYQMHWRKKWKKFLFLALRLQFTRVNRGNANAKKGFHKKNRFHRFHATTAQWSSRTDLWSMGNQNPTRDLMS